MTKRSLSVIALILYLVLTIVLTFPVVAQLTERAAGAGADLFHTLANAVNQTTRFNDEGVLAVLGQSLLNINLDVTTLNGLLGYFFGLPLGYNLLWLFSFLAAAWGTYQLVLFVLRRQEVTVGVNQRLGLHAAAFIAGLVYAFSPVHVAWAMGFRGATHIEWIPFLTLFLLKFFTRPALKYLFASAFFFILLLGTDIHFVAAFALFLIALLVFQLIRQPSLLRDPKFLAILFAGFMIISGLAFWQNRALIEISLSEENYLDPGLNQATHYSNDLLSYVIPPERQSLWGDRFASIRERFTGNPAGHSAYIGLTVTALIVVLVVLRKKGEYWFWLVAGFAFYLLSLGPFLHIAGVIEPRIPLPFLAIHQSLPFFDNIRAVNRFVIIAVLALAVAAAFGFSTLVKRFRLGRAMTVLAGAVASALIVVEYLSTPWPTTAVTPPAFYKQLISDPTPYSILEIPSSTSYQYATRVVYYQSLHHKKVIGGLNFARKQPAKFDQQKNKPVIRELLYLLPNGEPITDIVEYEPAAIAPSVFRDWDIRYIILNKTLVGEAGSKYTAENYRGTRAYIEEQLHLSPIHEDGELVAYQPVLPSEETFTYVGLEHQTAWQKPVFKKNATTRLMRSGAALNLQTTTLAEQTHWLTLTFTNETAMQLSYTVDNTNSQSAYYLWPGYNNLLLPVVTSGSRHHLITFNLFGVGIDPSDQKIRVQSIALTDEPPPISAYPNSPRIQNDEGSRLHTPTFAIPLVGRSIDKSAQLYALPFWKQLVDGGLGSGNVWLSAQDIFAADYYGRAVKNALALPGGGELPFDLSRLPKNYGANLATFFQQWQPGALRYDADQPVVQFGTEIDQSAPLPAISGSGWRRMTVTNDGQSERELKGNSILWLYQPTDQDSSTALAFTVRGLLPLVDVAVEYNGAILHRQSVPVADTVVTVPLPPLQAGWHALTFRAFSNGQEFSDRNGVKVFIHNLAIN